MGCFSSKGRRRMWASGYIKKLQEGQQVEFRPRGNSMKPLIESGDLVVVEPVKADTPLDEGDIVLCKVKGKQYLHLISAVQAERFQISNNRGFVNGWISRNSIFGKMVMNKGKQT